MQNHNAKIIDNERWFKNKTIVTTCFWVTLALVIGLTTLIYLNTRELIQNTDKVTHTLVVLERLENILSITTSAEDAQRGYLITANTDFLKPFTVAVDNVPQLITDLRGLTADSPNQQGRLDTLQPLLISRLTLLQDGITIRDEKGFAAAQQFAQAGSGEATMDEIRSLVATMKAEETRLLEDREGKSAASAERVLIVFPMGIILSLVLYAMIFILLNRQIAVQPQIQQALGRSEGRFWLLIETAPGAILLVDRNGKITFVNERVETMFGYQQNELINMPIEMLLPEHLRDGHTAFRSGFFAKPGSRPMGLGRDLTGRRKDGTEFPVEIGLSYATTEDGILALAFVTDITERKRADETRQLLATIVELSEDAILSRSLDGTIWSWNKGAEKLYGYSAVEAVGKSIMMLFPPDGHEEFAVITSRLKRAETIEKYETIRRRKDGTLVVVSLTVSPIKNAHGNVVGASVIGRDITELNRAHESALLASEDRYRQIVETAQEGIWVTDADSKTTFVNARMAEMLGYTAAEMLELPVNSFLFEEDQASIDSNRQQRRQGVPAFRLEFRLRRKDRTNLWVLISATPRFDDKRRYLGSVALVTDITERKRADDALRASEERYRRIVETAQEGIWQLDADDNTSFVNKKMAEMLGYTPEEMLGKSMYDFLSDKGRQTAISHQEVRRQGIGGTVETNFQRKDGTVTWVLAARNPIRDKDGHYAGWLAMVMDISERKQVEQQIISLNRDLERRTIVAEAANKELESFSYSISHDLRAPLRAIDGFSRILMEEHATKLDAELVRYLQNIRRNAQRMGDLIDDLLTFSRLGRQQVKKIMVSPANIVRQVLEDFQQQRADRQIEISIDQLPDCQADPALLRQVYENLVGNAIKFTGKQSVSQVMVGYQQLEGNTVYFVKDNGVGFDMQYADKLFGVFQRLHSMQEFPGTGVGLAIVHRIITRHGGRIWAEAEINKGATFFFTLGDDHD